jgi:transposase
MELAGYVANAVVLEGRSVREVARAHGVSKSWLYELVARYRAGDVPHGRPEGDASNGAGAKRPLSGGEEGLQLRSKRPRGRWVS